MNPHKKTEALAQAAAMAFVVLWSSGYPAGKIGVQYAGPFTLLVLRFAGAAVIFALLAAAARAPLPSARAAWHSAVVGLLSLALQFAGIYGGLRLGASAGVAGLFIGIMPLATTLMASRLGEAVTARQWLGLALGLAGVALVVSERFGTQAVPATAYFCLLAGMLGASVGTLYQKRHATRIDLRHGLLIQHLAAGVVLLPLALGLEGFQVRPVPAFYGALAWVILVNSVGGFALLFWLLRRGAATRVAALFYLVPAVTAVYGFVLLGERLSLLKLGGFAFAAFGVYLSTSTGVSGPVSPPKISRGRELPARP